MMKQKEYESTVKYEVNKVNKNRNILKMEFPHVTKRGRWETTEDCYWSGGFFVGMLWLAYKISSDGTYKESAYEWLKRLECRKNDKNMLFDLGSMFYKTF